MATCLISVESSADVLNTFMKPQYSRTRNTDVRLVITTCCLGILRLGGRFSMMVGTQLFADFYMQGPFCGAVL